MKILIAGASGMLGRALVGRLSKTHDILGVSKSGNHKTLPLDLSSPEAAREVFSKNSFDLVIHTAGLTDVDGCERDPKRAHHDNALSAKNIAKECGQKKIPFIYVSTDYVFDGQKKTAYTEEDRTGPVNIYGMTKLEGEYFTRQYAFFSCIVRTSWLFGEGNPNNFVNAIFSRLKTQKEVKVLDDQVDSPTYTEDLAAAVEKLGNDLLEESDRHTSAKVSKLFHFCNSGATTRLGMTLKMREILKLKEVQVLRLDKKDLKDRLAKRPPYAVMSTALFEKTFNTKIRSWEESLKDYLGKAALCVS